MGAIQREKDDFQYLLQVATKRINELQKIHKEDNKNIDQMKSM